jgi:hypothetical protein
MEIFLISRIGRFTVTFYLLNHDFAYRKVKIGFSILSNFKHPSCLKYAYRA